MCGYVVNTFTGFASDVVEVRCNQGFEGGGISTCDGASLVFTDVSPCVPASCPTLNISNSLHGTYDGVYGDEIQIQCHVGYVAYQPDLICGEHLHWNHNPRCDPQPCDSVIIENSIQEIVFGLTNDQVEVECLPGFSGGGVAICQGDTLNFSHVSPCTAQECTPDTIPHSVSYDSENSLRGVTGDVVEVICNQGYGPGGVTTCSGETLTFTPHVSCDQSNICDELSVPNSNVSNYRIGIFGDVVRVQCNEGYSGSRDVTCQDTREWSQTPSCVPSSCHVVTSAKSCNAMTVADCMWDYRNRMCRSKPCDAIKTRSRCTSSTSDCVWNFGRCFSNAGCSLHGDKESCSSNSRCRWLSGNRCVTVSSG